MPETRSSPTLPRPRQPPGAWNGPGEGFVSRYDSGRDGSGVRVTGIVLVAIVLFAAAVVVVPGTVGPGLGIAAVGVGVALVLAGLNSPTVAITLFVVTLFFRQGLKIEALPAEPYLFAFAGVLGAGGVALTRQRSRVPQLGPVEGMMATFVLWAIGSAVLPHAYAAGEENPAHYFILLGIFVPFVLYVVGRTVVNTERAVRVLLWVLLWVWAYSVLHSILQFHAEPFAWPDTVADYSDSASWSNRALGVFGNPVENGFLLVVGFMFALYLARDRRVRPVVRLLLYAMAVLSMYSIYLTRTRIIYLAFGLMLVVGVLFLRRLRVLSLTLLGAGTVVGLVNLPTLLSADRNSGGLTSSYEIQDRLNMIATAWWGIKQNPLYGWGIGRFASVNTYHHKQWSHEVPWFRGYGIKAHVNELGIATELGLVGLVIWLTILVLVARRLRDTIRTLPGDPNMTHGREFAVLLASFGVLWFLIGLTVDLRYLSFANAMVWLLAGVAVGLADRGPAPPDVALDPGVAATSSTYLDADEELYLRWVAAR